MSTENENLHKFWSIRAAKYDKLYWTRDEGYLQAIVEAGELRLNHVALDVGTGTGVIARKIRPLVKHVVAVDISSDMLQNGQWEGVSVVNLDIGECFFADAVFDRVFARMVFHHILDNIDRALVRVFDVLRPGGIFVLAEGVPPTDDPAMVQWYSEMFAMKEQRRTFIPGDLVAMLERNAFTDVQCAEYIMPDFSIRNWISNSGLDAAAQDKIMHFHLNAPDFVKKAYKMRVVADDCLVVTRNMVVTGRKSSNT